MTNLLAALTFLLLGSANLAASLYAEQALYLAPVERGAPRASR